MQPLVIAHRGASGEAPENTLAAFELARTQRADMIEIDVRTTADNALVIFHDNTSQRWNERADLIESLTLAQVRDIRIGGEMIPTMDELCDWARSAGMPLNVEIKSHGIEAAVAASLRSFDLVEQVIVSSFYPDVLAALRSVAPELPRAVLMGTDTWKPAVRVREAWPLRALRNLDAAAWHPANALPLLDRMTRLVRKQGFKVNVWTVDDPTTMRHLIELGVDGIITNLPARLRSILDELG